MIQKSPEFDNETLDLRARMFGSLLFFTQTFYKLRTGRDFQLSYPTGRESRHITVCRALTDVFRLKTRKLLINIHPGSGKSELCRHFIAWSLAQYPDSNFLYISFSLSRAESNTAVIKDIMSLPEYRKIFGVKIDPNFDSRRLFKTTAGGTIAAFGSGGSITGADAGIFGITDRFNGAILMDDMHKPDEDSDIALNNVIENYKNTIRPRPRSTTTGLIYIGQRLNEADLGDYLIQDEDWTKVILPTEDAAGNILSPELFPPEEIEDLKKAEYMWAAQHQQNPMPAGGAIFKEKDFVLLDKTPNILATVVTVDTAETDKTYNDKTVFSFFGLHKITIAGRETDVYGLHWLNCLELSVEPKDLEREFLAFYVNCLQFPVKPELVGIEKKSTGVTLISVLKGMPGLQILEIQRTKISGSKTTRFLEMQPFVAKNLISLPKDAKHTNMCIKHCGKITANDSHRWDDIADTLYDAVKIALIDKVLITRNVNPQRTAKVVKNLAANFNKIQKLRREITWQP